MFPPLKFPYMELHVHNTALMLIFNYPLIPFAYTRLDNMEYVPVILNEYLEDLREGGKHNLSQSGTEGVA